MAQSALSSVHGIYRYPVKGLSPESLERTSLAPGEAVPFDRAYAIENGAGRFDPEAPQHLSKLNFLMLMRDERLATLRSQFDEQTHTLTIYRDHKQVARGQLSTLLGRKMIEQFLAAYMQEELRGAPRIVFAEGHSFADANAKYLHIVNLETLRELERAAGAALSPLRFRPNVIIDGVGAWEELSWVGKTVAVGDVELDVVERTSRCAATDVDPETGKRETALAAVLRRTWGHTDFGIYARVVRGGTIAVGDPVALRG